MLGSYSVYGGMLDLFFCGAMVELECGELERGLERRLERDPKENV